MDYITILKDVIELIITILTFAPLAADMPILLPLAGIITALLWLNQDRNPRS